MPKEIPDIMKQNQVFMSEVQNLADDFTNKVLKDYFDAKLTDEQIEMLQSVVRDFAVTIVLDSLVYWKYIEEKAKGEGKVIN